MFDKVRRGTWSCTDVAVWTLPLSLPSRMRGDSFASIDALCLQGTRINHYLKKIIIYRIFQKYTEWIGEKVTAS